LRLDLSQPLAERGVVDLSHHHLIPALSCHLGDAVAHQPRPEHAYLLDLLRHHTSAWFIRLADGSLLRARRPGGVVPPTPLPDADCPTFDCGFPSLRDMLGNGTGKVWPSAGSMSVDRVYHVDDRRTRSCPRRDG